MLQEGVRLIHEGVLYSSIYGISLDKNHLSCFILLPPGISANMNAANTILDVLSLI